MTEDPDLLMARDSFEAYMALVHRTDTPLWGGAAVPARHHQVMIEALTNNSLGYTLIVTPRGSGKTTLMAGWIEWELGRASLGLNERNEQQVLRTEVGPPADTGTNIGAGELHRQGQSGLDGGTDNSGLSGRTRPARRQTNRDWANDFRVIYFSNTAHQAYRVSNVIKATIESNQVYQALFPKVKPHRDKWSQEEWKVAGNNGKDANFMAIGVGGPALGARALIMVFDDIADQENMRTAAQRELVRLWLDHTALPILVPWGRMVMSCTRWAWDDPANWALERGWHPIYMKALEEDEGNLHSYWPERFPVEWLLEKQRESPSAFARQYQNEVAPEEGQTFLREWFEPRYSCLPPEVLFVANSWDTAAGVGRNRSFSAGWSAAITSDWHIYLFNLNRGQVLYPYLREAVKMQAERDRADYVIIEKKSSGHQLIDEFNIEYARGLHSWKVIEWQPAGQKGSVGRRAYAEEVTDFCAKGRVHLPSEYFLRRAGSHWLTEAETEIFSYPDGQTDDIVDALCQLIYYVRGREQAAMMFLAQPRDPVLWAPSDTEGEKVIV